MRIAFYFTVLLIFSASGVFAQGQTNGSSGSEPEFVSDGCTFFPDGDYGDCCVEHDKAYKEGGSLKARRAADGRLYDCVRAKGHKFIAPVMWAGVRLGGVRFLPTRFRWGFGKKKKASKPPDVVLPKAPPESTDP